MIASFDYLKVLLQTVDYRGQERANLAAASLAALSVVADLRPLHSFQIRGALRVKEAFLAAAGTATRPAAAARVFADARGTCSVSCRGEEAAVALQASMADLKTAILL